MKGGNKVLSFPRCLHKKVWRMNAPGKSVRNVRKVNRLAFNVSPLPIRASRSICSSLHELASASSPSDGDSNGLLSHPSLSLLLLLSLDSRDIPACREQGAGESGWRREKRRIGVHYATNLGTHPDASESKEHEEQQTECAALPGKDDSTQLQGWNKGVFLKKNNIFFMLQIIKKLQLTENHKGCKQ